MNQVIIPHAQANAIKIDGAIIRQDQFGRYCLNDLHKASGAAQKDQPRYFLENKQTDGLIEALTDSGIPLSPIEVIRGGLHQGTYVVKELVYAYAMWISPVFHLTVIRTFDALATQKQVQALPNFADPVAAARAWADEVEAKQLALEQIAVLEPKAQALDTIADTSGTYCLRDCAKTIGIKEQDLVKLLEEKKWIYRDPPKHPNKKGKIQPYAQYVTNGVFIKRPTSPQMDNSGVERVHLTMRVTAFGLTRITGLVNKQRGNAA